MYHISHCFVRIIQISYILSAPANLLDDDKQKDTFAWFPISVITSVLLSQANHQCTQLLSNYIKNHMHNSYMHVFMMMVLFGYVS